MTRLLLTAFVLCFAAAALEPPPAPADAPLWVTQLTAGERSVRQAAMENLRKAGESVRPLIEEAAKSGEKDRAVSAKWLLAILKTAPTLEKAKAAMNATKPVKASVVFAVGRKDETSTTFKTMGDGRRAQVSAPWANLIADGEFVWTVITVPGTFPDEKAQTLVTKRTVEDFNAERPGALNKLPGIVYLDAMSAAFDFVTITEGREAGADVLFLEGWLKRPEIISQQAILKQVREGKEDAQLLMLFANIRGLQRLRIALEKSSFILLNMEMQDRDAKVLETTRFDYDYTPMSKEKFAYVPPKDAQVVEVSGALQKLLKGEVKAFMDKQRAKNEAKEKN